jgi:hypothetical protein
MRFSIRDLLWLTVVVALGATVYTERTQMQRMKMKWEELSEKQAQQTAMERAKLQATINELHQQHAIVSHQLTVQLQKARQRDEADRWEREAAAALLHRDRFRPGVEPPDEQEN